MAKGRRGRPPKNPNNTADWLSKPIIRKPRTRKSKNPSNPADWLSKPIIRKPRTHKTFTVNPKLLQFKVDSLVRFTEDSPYLLRKRIPIEKKEDSWNSSFFLRKGISIEKNNDDWSFRPISEYIIPGNIPDVGEILVEETGACRFLEIQDLDTSKSSNEEVDENIQEGCWTTKVLSEFDILGPIPNLDALKFDNCSFNKFFEDIPDIEDV